MIGNERPAAPATVRLLTWNLHAGIGPDGRFDLDRIVTLVRHHDPDIVALQEIDSRGRGDDSPFDMLAAALGSHAAEARTITAPDGYYGHALISRWPLHDVAVHDLSVHRREPRRAIEATVADRKRVGSGKSVSVRVDLGGGRAIT